MDRLQGTKIKFRQLLMHTGIPNLIKMRSVVPDIKHENRHKNTIFQLCVHIILFVQIIYEIQ
jgi:hypothetical protein